MKQFLKKTIIYDWLRSRKSTRLDRKYIGLLNRIYSNKNKKSIITKIPLKIHEKSKPVILGVGHQDWEKYGFWEAMKNVSDFSFFKLESNVKNISVIYQFEIASEIKQIINNSKIKQKIDIVFFYCDASYLNKDLLEYIRDEKIFCVLMGLDDKHKFEYYKKRQVMGGQEYIIPYVDLYWTTWK
jgi:hypothetical protein